MRKELSPDPSAVWNRLDVWPTKVDAGAACSGTCYRLELEWRVIDSGTFNCNAGRKTKKDNCPRLWFRIRESRQPRRSIDDRA